MTVQASTKGPKKVPITAYLDTSTNRVEVRSGWLVSGESVASGIWKKSHIVDCDASFGTPEETKAVFAALDAGLVAALTFNLFPRK